MSGCLPALRLPARADDEGIAFGIVIGIAFGFVIERRRNDSDRRCDADSDSESIAPLCIA